MNDGWISVTAVALLAAVATPAHAANLRTCFYSRASGGGLWATRQVRCATAGRVFRDATRKCGHFCNAVFTIDGYRCKLFFGGGGDGTCTASRGRRIRFIVP